MDQCTIVVHMALKELSPGAIHKDLMDTLGLDAVVDSSLTRYLREGWYLPSDQGTPSVEDDRDIDEADQAILFTLDQNPFASVRQLSQLTHIPSTTIYRRLTQSLGFTTRHLR
jgi:hypothetical protein